jgi:sterol desaturase/sphingolipid hydroxylase (fatty acid hydroxylase superfamily)
MRVAAQLFALMAVFTVLEGQWPSSRAHKWWRRPLLVDLCGWLIHPLSMALGIALAAAAANAVTASMPQHGWWLEISKWRTAMAERPAWIQVTIAFLVADFLSYWIHRAYHYFPFLWAFHVVHHTSEDLDWLSTSRLHPVSQALDTAAVGFALLLLGLPVTAVVVANILIGAAALLVHANVRWTFGPVQHLIVSPLFHQWHHAHPDDEHSRDIGNFGAVLSVWDRLFGTWSLPALRRPARFGAANAPPPTMLGLVLHPLRVCIRFLLNRNDS